MRLKPRSLFEIDRGQGWLMFTEQTNHRKSEASPASLQRVVYFALPTLLIIGALIAYKSSAALAVIDKVSATGALTPRSNVIPLVGASGASVLTRTGSSGYDTF